MTKPAWWVHSLFYFMYLPNARLLPGCLQNNLNPLCVNVLNVICVILRRWWADINGVCSWALHHGENEGLITDDGDRWRSYNHRISLHTESQHRHSHAYNSHQYKTVLCLEKWNNCFTNVHLAGIYENSVSIQYQVTTDPVSMIPFR